MRRRGRYGLAVLEVALARDADDTRHAAVPLGAIEIGDVLVHVVDRITGDPQHGEEIVPCPPRDEPVVGLAHVTSWRTGNASS